MTHTEWHVDFADGERVTVAAESEEDALADGEAWWCRHNAGIPPRATVSKANA